MFTGIIEEIGTVKKSVGSPLGTMSIETQGVISDVKIGDSIAVNGVCLTVTKVGANKSPSLQMSFDVRGETLSLSNLKDLKPGDKVNLESSLKAGGLISGHFVYGHIDGTRPVIDKGRDHIDIGIEKDDEKYVVHKGSVAVDGISLTIAKAHRESIRIFLIPHTLNNTTLLDKKKGDMVNIEFDMISKYVHKQHGVAKGVTGSSLRDAGFDKTGTD